MAVESSLSRIPAGIEHEKASLVIAMLLTSKIGKSIPSLLQSCFTTAVSFIQGNYNAYVEGLAEEVRNCRKSLLVAVYSNHSQWSLGYKACCYKLPKPSFFLFIFLDTVSDGVLFFPFYFHLVVIPVSW